jgi:NAD(P)-dependent dehydrogenase (short-subunit alcohol dehydrogenase family)
MDFSEKTVVITGIGEALARLFAGRGARLAIVDIHEPNRNAVAQALADAGAQTLAVQCDVSDAQSVAGACAAIERRFGAVDLLINNAAAQQFGAGTIDSIDLDDYRKSSR